MLRCALESKSKEVMKGLVGHGKDFGFFFQ